MRTDSKIAIVCAALVVGLFIVAAIVRNNPGDVATHTNVRLEDGVQIIELTAKGGFAPSSTMATAGLPTELRVNTQGTFDCSSVLVIPSLGYQKSLPPTGTEVIMLNAEQAAGTLQGTCGMGMYRFTINFK